MIGHPKNFSRHQAIVDEYLKDHSPETIKTDIPFNLRGYLDYMDSNQLSSPKDVPDEVLSSFMIEDEHSKMLA